jgi:hypothetical protein
MEKGIKELLELIEGLKQLGLVGRAVLKDGKVDLSDLNAITLLLGKQDALLAAFNGVANVPGEVKDLTLDEALVVVYALVDAAKEVKNS